MLSLTTQLVALLDHADDLRSATGKDFTAHVAEVWNLPGSIVYPVLVISPEGTSAVPEAISTTFEGNLVRFWYVTDGTMLEAITFRDALRSKLHLKQDSLRSAGLYVQHIKCVDSRVMQRVDTNKHQAYLEFRVIA